MNPGADVRSLEALRDWYSNLAQFRSEAQNAQTTINLALQRAADWLEEQQQYWQRQVRQAYEDMVQAKTHLRSRKSLESDIYKPDCSEFEEDLERAMRRLEYCEDRQERTRRWQHKLPVVIRETYDGPSRNLTFFLDADLPRALAELGRQMTSLERYLGIEVVPRREVH